jgi:hypothetical protein
VDTSAEAARFRAALTMADLGVRLMHQNLRRRDPDASAADIEDRLRHWLTSRPPDADGRPRPVSTR